jgi:hypothetical protein
VFCLLYFRLTSTTRTPIRVDRQRKGKRRPNVFIDNRGHPDVDNDWEWISAISVGKSIRRRTLHPPSHDVDSSFNISFDESKHGEYLRTSLDLSHLLSSRDSKVISLIKKY